MCASMSALSVSALSLVLDALEQGTPATRRSLADSTGLGLSTVTRAVTAYRSCGILRAKSGTDPVSGRACSLFYPADGILMPVVSVSPSHGVIRVLDTDLTPVGTAVTEFFPASHPDDMSRILAHRCRALLRGCSRQGEIGVAAPILLTADGLCEDTLCRAMENALGLPPLGVMSYGEAVARALRRLSLPFEGDSLLLVSVGEPWHACLLLRDGEGKWKPSSLGEGLTTALTRTVRDSRGSVRRGVAVFLSELCRYLRPDGILLEDFRKVLPEGGGMESLLPAWVKLTVYAGRDGLSLSEEGAALAGRRMLWDQILRELGGI